MKNGLRIRKEHIFFDLGPAYLKSKAFEAVSVAHFSIRSQRVFPYLTSVFRGPFPPSPLAYTLHIVHSTYVQDLANT